VSVNSFRPFTGEARVRAELDGQPLMQATYLAGNRLYDYPSRRTLAAGEHVVRFFLDLSRAVPNAGRAITVALDELRWWARWDRRCASTAPPTGGCSSGGRRPGRPRPATPMPRDPPGGRPIAPSAARPTSRRWIGWWRLAEEAERQSGRFESGIASALQAILVSPRFLFRVEGDAPHDGDAPAVALDEHALAARLSYLLHAAAPTSRWRRWRPGGSLRDNLEAEVRRLLADPRSERFVSRFVGQWLRTRDVETVPIAATRAGGADPAHPQADARGDRAAVHPPSCARTAT
jgi:hypothetical protein